MMKSGDLFFLSLIVFGVALLLFSLLGEKTSLGHYDSAPPRTWEEFNQQLLKETPDLTSMQKKLTLAVSQSVSH